MSPFAKDRHLSLNPLLQFYATKDYPNFEDALAALLKLEQLRWACAGAGTVGSNSARAGPCGNLKAGGDARRLLLLHGQPAMLTPPCATPIRRSRPTPHCLLQRQRQAARRGLCVRWPRRQAALRHDQPGVDDRCGFAWQGGTACAVLGEALGLPGLADWLLPLRKRPIHCRCLPDAPPSAFLTPCPITLPSSPLVPHS